MPPRRSPFWRYTALQAPGWLMAATGGWWIHTSFDAPGWLAPAIPVFWVAKDLALYPLLRGAYEGDERPPVERLVGCRGVAVEPLAPAGYVRIGAELWRARASGAASIAPQRTVEVVGAAGLVLSVRQHGGEEAETRAGVEVEPQAGEQPAVGASVGR